MFDLLKKRIKSRRRKTLISFMRDSERGSVLDVSCGTGEFLAELRAQRPGLELSGADISKADIETAKREHAEISFTVAPAHSLPFPNAAFDMVTCSLSLHHYSDASAVMNEVARVLKPKGRFYLTDALPTSRLFQSLLNRIGCSEPYHFEKYYREKEAQDLAASFGLALTSKTSMRPFSFVRTLEFTRSSQK